MGSGSGMDPQQSTDFSLYSPSRTDTRGTDRAGLGGLWEGEGMRISSDGRLKVGTEKENLCNGNGNSGGNLPVVSESVRNLRTEKARYAQYERLPRIVIRTHGVTKIVDNN